MVLSRMLAEVVQRGAGVAVVGCAGALRPAHEVVHGVGEHAERLPGRGCRGRRGSWSYSAVGRALEGGEQREPAERGGGERCAARCWR